MRSEQFLRVGELYHAEMAAQQKNPSLSGHSLSHYQVLSLLGGQHFPLNAIVEAGTKTPLTVMVNWTAGLKNGIGR